MAWIKSVDRMNFASETVAASVSFDHVHTRFAEPITYSAPDDRWREVMAKMSHDFRTPLNAVIGFADLMQSELHGELGHHRYREYVDHIRSCGAELLKAAEETLLMTALVTSPGIVTKDDVPLLQVIKAAMTAVRATADAKDVQMEPGVCEHFRVEADRRATGLALTYLLTAALRAAPFSGTLSLRATLDHGVARLDIKVDEHQDGASSAATPIDCAELILARELFNVQGARLIDGRSTQSSVDYTVLFAQPAQHDLFRD